MSSSSQVQMISRLKKLETGIVILILVYSSGVWWHVQPMDLGEIGVQSSGQPTIINLGIYLFTLIGILTNWKRFFYVLTRDKFLLILVGIAVLSIFWSGNLDKSIAMTKGMIRVTLFGVYLATRYSMKEQLHLLAWTCGIVAVLSLAVCLAIPSQGIQAARLGETAGWRGLLYHKNHFGRLMVFSSGAFLLLALSNSKYRQVLWTGFGLSLSLVLLSNSKTSLSTFLAILMLFPLWLILRRKSYNLRMFFIHTGALLVGLMFVGITYYVEVILTSMGKDMTWTGRIPLWTILLKRFAEKPLLGYGYYGFWNKNEIYNISKEMANKWGGGHAHNGFMEIALALGLFGLSILVLGLLRSCWRAINYARLAKTAEGLWPLQVLTIIIFVNIAIGMTFLSPQYLWMLHVSITCTLALQCDRQKRNKFRRLEEAKNESYLRNLNTQ